MLRDLNLKAVYRSEGDDLLSSFYIPCLKNSIHYDRAVGFFSGAMLSLAAQGIAAIVGSGGKMRLIFGGELDAADADAIENGYRQREIVDKIDLAIIRAIDEIADALVRRRLETLSWMVANGMLDIRIALRKRGMYHEKIGIFTDAEGDRVVFQGSANETAYALLPDFNFESINVFQSWRRELQDHYLPYVDGFERLWTNKTRGTIVLDFPDASQARLIQIAKRSAYPDIENELRVFQASQVAESPLDSGSDPKFPTVVHGEPYQLRDHQRQALNAWRAKDFQGVLAIATGAGKTIIALHGMTVLYTSLKRLFVVIAVPYQSLADQWIDSLRKFSVAAVSCYESIDNWVGELTQLVTLFESNATKFIACVVVNHTLRSPEFQKRLIQVPAEYLLFVGDECHHHSSPGLAACLPKARFRLGLSATPEHYVNHDLTARLLSYYGPIAFRYTLADALRDKVLTPYKYFVHVVELNKDETESYVEITERVSRSYTDYDPEDSEENVPDLLQLLLFKRARIIGNAEHKIAKLRFLLQNSHPKPFQLFYCGDGFIDGDEPGDELRQVEVVSRLLYEHGWRVSRFTAQESRDERRQILDHFRIGVIDGLVAIRCLDEGIDVPDCRTAYVLASSRNPKQFIQRRGRILRRAPGKELATVHDFVVRIPAGITGQSAAERRLLIAELRRVAEFASLATNRHEVFKTLLPLLTEYDLHHHF